MYRERFSHTYGMTFIDVLIGTAIMTLIFTGLFSAFKLSLELYGLNKARTGAVALGNERIEQLRALPYDQVGTVNGLPPGAIPQLESVAYNGVTYTVRTFIKYIDDPADGTAGAGDLLAADYKQAKVEVTWPLRDTTQTVSLVTNMVPKGEESLTGAGVLRVNVLDASLVPVFGALVHIINTTVATSVDVTTLTNASGTVSFPGAWAGAGYGISISKAGYSSAQTYTASPSNQNPSPSPATVEENGTTALLFQIDRVSSMLVTTALRPTHAVLDDAFDDATNLALQASTTVSGGSLMLDGGVGAYAALGTAESVGVSSVSLSRWLLLSFSDVVPANTSVQYIVLYDTGSGFAPVPDADLPGNAAGFTTSPINIGVLSTSTYPKLRIQARLTSSDQNVTPEVTAWHLSYELAGAAVPNSSFSIRGTKTIGTDSDGGPVYKYAQNLSTNASGALLIDPLEWDRYDITSTAAGYDVAEICPPSPRDIVPNIATTTKIVLAPQSANNLNVLVQSNTGAALSGVEVKLSGPSTDVTRATSACGQTFFSGLTADTYTLSTTFPGYQATSTSVPVSGASATTLVIQP